MDDDESGPRILGVLRGSAIDTSRLALKQGYERTREVIFAAEATRTTFGTYGGLLESGHWNMSVAGDSLHAKVIRLDPFFRDASMRVAMPGPTAGIPLFTVYCGHENLLVRQLSALVVAKSCRDSKHPDSSSEEVLERYLRATDGRFVFTFGGRGTWCARPGQPIRSRQSYRVETADTCGAGDSFRARIVYGHLRGSDDDQLVDFASALAAIVCTRTPGALNSPGYDEVLPFISAAGA